jgi:hypothetical protein
MLDAVRLERLGVPSVVVAHHNFEFAARTQAKLMGIPDIKLAVMPRPSPTWDAAKKQEVIQRLGQTVVASLVEGGAVK